MNVLKIINTFLFLCLLTACTGIHSIKKDKYTLKYGPDLTYSRTLICQNSHVYLGNSDGYLYAINLRKNKCKRLTTKAFPEIRDISIHHRNLIGMQSNDTSFLVCYNTGIENNIVLGTSPVFLDGMDILPSGNGFLMGDPVGDFFSLYTTTDFGNSWTALVPKIPAMQGEAGFAASGSTVKCLNDSTFVFVSGGAISRFFKTTNRGQTWTSVVLPYKSGPGSGPFSLCCMNEQEMVVVGGDYTQPTQSDSTSFYSFDGGKSWQTSAIPTLGYRSCVIYHHNTLYACGTTGIDVSFDKGKTWESFQKGNYFALLGHKGKLIASKPNGQLEIIDL
jgi:hypothetical protein